MPVTHKENRHCHFIRPQSNLPTNAYVSSQKFSKINRKYLYFNHIYFIYS